MWLWVCNSSHLPVQPASGQGRCHGVKSFFFLSPLKQQRKGKKKKTNTRDDGQGSTHVLGFRRTCCYGNAGYSLHARSRVRAATPSPRRAAEDACVRGGRGPGPPNSRRGDRLSQEHFLLPHGGRVGAPEAVFAALLRKQVSRR